MITIFSKVRFTLCLAIFSSIVVGLFAAGQPRAEDLAWEKLTKRSAPPSDRRQAEAVDWTELSASADDFVKRFPDDARAKTARRISLSAQIHAVHTARPLPQDVVERARSYIRDSSNPSSERANLRVDLEFGLIVRRPKLSSQELRTERTSLGRDVMREFPGEPNGYGLLLISAKTESPTQAQLIASEILSSKAPQNIKQGARKVLDRLSLLNKRLRLKGVPELGEQFKERPVVIYTWTKDDLGFLELIKRSRSQKDVTYIGINLDPDTTAGKALAVDLPGVQYYDGGGLEGPLAKQLYLIFTTSIYTLNAKGVVRSLDGHVDPLGAISRVGELK